MNTKTGSTVEGGLLIAVSLLLGLATVYLPVLGAVLEFFWSVPFAVLVIRHGLSKAITALIASTLLLFLFVGPVLALRLSLAFGPIGLAIGYCLQRKFNAVQIFIVTLGAAFAAQVLSMAFLFFVMDIDFVDTQLTMMREAFEDSFVLYSEMGVDQATIDQARASVEPTISTMTLLMPTIIALMALVNALVSYWASKKILRKLDVTMPDFPPFAEWRFPIVFLYMMGFALVGMYWGVTRDIGLLYDMSINANVLAMLVGLIQGFSLISFAADRYKLSKPVRRLIYVALFFNGLLLQAVAFTGLFDMYFDYRKRLTQKK